MEDSHVASEKSPIALYLFHWKEFLDTTFKNIPSSIVYLTAYLLGVVNVFNRLEINMLGGKRYFFSAWSEVLAVSLLGGILAGFLGYWLNGFFVKLGIIFSGGKSKGPLTRKLVVFSYLPMISAGILFILVKVLFFHTFSLQTSLYTNFTTFEMGANLILSFYSFYLLLSGITHLFGTSLRRTLFVFIGIPLLLITLLVLLPLLLFHLKN